MAKRGPVEAEKSQLLFENILKWYAFGITLLFLLMSILRYFDSKSYSALSEVEKTLVLFFALAAIIYLIITRIEYPRTMYRVKAFLKELFCPETAILSGILIWYLLCCISANTRYTAEFFSINRNALFDCFTVFFVIFPLFLYFGQSGDRKALELLIHILSAVSTVAMLYVILHVFKPEVITLRDGGQIGMSSSVRLYINCNPNTTGAYSEVLFFLCLYMVFTGKGLKRWLYLFAACVHFIILALSNSRTCVLATMIASAAIAFKAVYDLCEKRSAFQRIAFSAVAAAAGAGLILGLRSFVFLMFEEITHFSELIDTDGSFVRELNANSSGRTIIWKAALHSVFSSGENAFFGVTPEGVISEISKFTDGRFQMYTHNEFLEVAVALGIPGCLAYSAWLVLIARSCIKIVFKKGFELFRGAYVIPAAILMLVIANLLEATLLFYSFLPEGMFFLLAGFVTYSLRSRSFIRS